MKKSGFAVVFVVLFLLGGLLVVRSRNTESERVRQRADTFLKTFMAGDSARALRCLTRVGQEKSASLLENNKSSLNGFTIGDISIDGDDARAAVVLRESSGSQSGGSSNSGAVLLRREAGEWRVRALEMSLLDGAAPITIDFEHPESLPGEALRMTGAAMGRAVGEMGHALGNAMGSFARGFQEGIEGKK